MCYGVFEVSVNTVFMTHAVGVTSVGCQAPKARYVQRVVRLGSESAVTKCVVGHGAPEASKAFLGQAGGERNYLYIVFQ